jgi:hypothetical protein
MSNNIYEEKVKNRSIVGRIFKMDNKSSNNCVYINKPIVSPGVIYFDSKKSKRYSIARPCPLYSNNDFILNEKKNSEHHYENLHILNKKMDKKNKILGNNIKINDINFYENLDLGINKYVKMNFNKNNKNNVNDMSENNKITRLLNKKAPDEEPPKRKNKNIKNKKKNSCQNI